MATLHFPEARKVVIERASAAGSLPGVEEVPLAEAAGRVLAEDVAADRDYPPTARSLRDGYAVRAAEVPGELRVTGEVRAGEIFQGTLGAGEAMEIMTGAPVPFGADAVLMVEHSRREGNRISTEQRLEPGAHMLARGAEARAGDILIRRGARAGYPEIAMLATVGWSPVKVYRKPRVAILATGDEIVEAPRQPAEFQIRNSNAHSLAVQVRSAGGEAEILPVARDTRESLRDGIGRGLQADLLLLSGGVSAGKYDLVEPVLEEFGAVFYFDRVLIQPGQPLVFGRARGTFFFGLPGNPISTMVTFELFARAALEVLSGQNESLLPVAFARLNEDYRHKTGLTRFIPARLDGAGGVTPIRWHGSSDVPSVARSNAFLIAEEDREFWAAGGMDWSAAAAMKSAKRSSLTHFDAAGSPRMVDVSAKAPTRRTARAQAFVRIAPEVLAQLPRNPKGNPLEIARIAGIAAAKRTWELIPLCHPLLLTHADVEATLEDGGVRIVATASTTAQTGVEMEALTAAAVAALTVYDMTKALDKSIEIRDVWLLEKTGGKSGGFKRGKKEK